jgi:hypothetical protein
VRQYLHLYNHTIFHLITKGGDRKVVQGFCCRKAPGAGLGIIKKHKEGIN